MFDPLASPFGSDDHSAPWPSTPHHPGSPVPNVHRSSSPAPVTPEKGPSTGPYGKEPQIYGQPEPGLISPAVGSNGKKYEKQGQYLRVRITGLDRNRRDILVKLDAQTNLSNFTGTTYRNVNRSYLEFQQFYDSLVHSNPQTIIPALPLGQTSAPTDEEDDRLVKIMLQRWITRVCEDPILLHDEDLRSFIESDFGYQPTPRPRRKANSGFGLIRRGVPDEDEGLQRARFELTKLEEQFFETAKAIDKLSVARKSMATAHAEMGNKLISVATTESHPALGNAFRKLGRTWHSVADLDQAQAISECVVIGDSLGYQGMNARSAKETLLQRTGVLEEYQAAVKTTISKRRHIERLKASSNIRPDRVDDALEDMEEANKYEQTLARRAEGISQNLHRALSTHNRLANDDITTALIEHARSSIMYERQLLRELEALKPDIENADKKAVPASNGVPKPSVVPPLEDFSKPLLPQLSEPDFVRTPPPNSSPNVPPKSSAPPNRPHVNSHSQPQRSSQSLGAGPSIPTPSQQPRIPVPDEPPLGGRFVDGTKSMFIKPSSDQQTPVPSFTSGPTQALRSPLAVSSSPSIERSSTDPLLGVPMPSGANGHLQQSQREVLDPLAQRKPNQFMSASVRVQPTRPRLDAREAASKLANMF